MANTKEQLATECLRWWQEDGLSKTFSNGEDEFNTFDSPPRFVDMAIAILGEDDEERPL